MNGLHYDDWHQFQELRGDDRCWKWPLNIAIIFHIAIFAGAAILPDIIERKPLLDDYVTVDLISMPEPPAAAPVATPPAPQQAARTAEPVQPIQPVSAPAPVPVVEPEIVEIPTPIPTPIEPEIIPEPAAPAEPISLTPVKRKKRIAKDTRLATEKNREKQNKILLEKKLAQQKAARRRAEQTRRDKALANAKREQVQLEQAEADAIRNLKARRQLAAQIQAAGAGTPTTTRSSGATGNGQQSSLITKQYLSSLHERISRFWILPETQSWNRSLETVMLLTIARSGAIINMEVERSSSDMGFDQEAKKTILKVKAEPMHPFPALMQQPSIKVRLRFTPAELAAM